MKCSYCQELLINPWDKSSFICPARLSHTSYAPFHIAIHIKQHIVSSYSSSILNNPYLELNINIERGIVLFDIKKSVHERLIYLPFQQFSSLEEIESFFHKLINLKVFA